MAINFKKKKAALVATLALGAVLAFGLAGCGAQSASSDKSAGSSDDKTITVAATPSPHAEILNNAVKPLLEKEGYTLEVKEFTDYVQPNTVTEEGEVDANYFQHITYLNNFNEEKGTHLVSVADVHYEPFGLYPGKTKSLDALADGATVAVPNDATNEARALLLLQDAGLITLKDDAGINATTNDIVSNPKNLQFKEVEAATVPNIVADVDIACINGNYAIPAGFKTTDALATESATSLAAEAYANVLVVKDGNQDCPRVLRDAHKGVRKRMIELDHLEKVYLAREGSHRALHDVSLTIGEGEIFGIIGQSGAGKSTLVRCINLLERPTSGRILIDGVDVTNYQGRDLRRLREGIGMIFQNFSLFQQRTVLDNVMFPLTIRGEKKDAAKKRALELLDVVELADKAHRYPSELSGGQQQRVAIARALANNPRIMLCDEATSALDTRTTVSVLNLLAKINKELGVTLVVITHSLAVARHICDRVAVIDEGVIVEEGPTRQVLENPQSEAARELVSFDSLEVK